MEKVSSLVELFKITNPFSIFVLCIIFLCYAANGIRKTQMPKEESVFTSKKDDIIYISLFIVFFVINFIFLRYLLYNFLIVLLSIIELILILFLLFSRICHKLDDIIIKCHLYPFVIAIMGALTSYSMKEMIDIKYLISIELIIALVESIICGLILSVYNDKIYEAYFYVIQEEKTWYVYKKINKKFWLCGDTINIKDSKMLKKIKCNSNIILHKKDEIIITKDEKNKSIQKADGDLIQTALWELALNKKTSVKCPKCNGILEISKLDKSSRAVITCECKYIYESYYLQNCNKAGE